MKMSEAPVLLVEDDSNDVSLLWRAFDKADLRNPLRVVRDGEEAIAYLDGRGLYVDRKRYPLPGLVLLDLKLPRRSGYEVLTWLSQQPNLQSILVVAMSSCREQSEIDRAYGLGIHSYLVKPTRWEDMVEMVKALGAYWMRFNANPKQTPRGDLIYSTKP
jgi:CheY-like chemotaxis protein